MRLGGCILPTGRSTSTRARRRGTRCRFVRVVVEVQKGRGEAFGCGGIWWTLLPRGWSGSPEQASGTESSVVIPPRRRKVQPELGHVADCHTAVVCPCRQDRLRRARSCEECLRREGAETWHKLCDVMRQLGKWELSVRRLNSDRHEMLRLGLEAGILVTRRATLEGPQVHGANA